MPEATKSAEVTPERAPLPPKTNDFSMCSESRAHDVMPEACWAV